MDYDWKEMRIGHAHSQPKAAGGSLSIVNQ
jgi:hypothetical protein